ncbi:hypothetical protein C8T65DRAFT_709367 [Cerioporus squamosus]|nr:hypothetical protein C8T65DRAFT_709367 [Cerioporus squamosus]
MLQWLPEADAYLDELMRLEGRGSYTENGCACGTKDAAAVYRCEDCCDLRLYCKTCTVASHAAHPLHRIRLWEDRHFSRVSLKSLGLRVQLGHQPGETCINPQAVWGDDFVLLDVFGVHELGVDYCGCETALPTHIQVLRARWFPATSVSPKTAATFRLLESYHLLATAAKVSVFEFYASLSRRTDNTGVNTPKDRYPAFLTMACEWRHLKMMKRGGRGNDPAGILATPEGACAVECPACPLPGKNLPSGWESVPSDKCWLYRMILAMDANFRLKRKKVSSDEVDPSLNDGCAYMVKTKPYHEHLDKFDDQLVEKNEHCNNHDAIKLATLKGGARLASTGVFSMDCARHDMKRPCSSGDLQKGERQVNADYVLKSSLRQNVPKDVLISYDVSCHFLKKINKRYDDYGWDPIAHNIVWAIPKFHIQAHREQCLADYNLRYLPGCGCSDCEGIERRWAQSNGAAGITKEMGPGSRRDYVDDIWGGQNWVKVTNLAAMLLNKIKKAVPERNAQVAAFKQYDSALPAGPKDQWKAVVEAWEADKTQPNPFFIKRPSITQAAIKRQLAEEDAEALKTGTANVLHERCSASGMVIAGVELEEAQRRLKVDVNALGLHATDIKRAKMQERQNALRRRFDGWAEIQQLYMPSVISQRAQLLAADENASLVYNLPLFLPSNSAVVKTCDATLLEHEWRLRFAQAFDALADLRGHLEVRTHLYKFKNRFARGQRANTRSQSLINAVDAKVNGDADRYRAAYAALQRMALHLGKQNWDVDLRPLLASDVRHVTEGEDGQSEGRRKISWIWKASSSSDAAETGNVADSLAESLRVEWCKARARAERWTEEVELLQEEMRRTIAYQEWAASSWDSYVDQRFADRPDYREGVNAYALRQSSMRKSMARFCEKSWRYVQAWAMAEADSVLEGRTIIDGGSSISRGIMPSLQSVSASSLASSAASYASSLAPSLAPSDATSAIPSLE